MLRNLKDKNKPKYEIQLMKEESTEKKVLKKWVMGKPQIISAD